jgi:hypothetical protein
MPIQQPKITTMELGNPMQSLIKTCAFSLITAGLTACGGGGGNDPVPTSPASSSASSVAPSSIPTSSAASSSAASSLPEGSEKTMAATSYANYSVAEIENCGVNINAADKTFAVFADYDGAAQNQNLSGLNISGWNHTTNGSTTEWANLKHAGSTYNFSGTATANDSCNGVDTMNVVLVKKIADWDRQHSNGFERNILAHGYKFGDIQNLIVDIKVNSTKTSVPSIENLKTTYAGYVDAATIEALDDGKVNIDITLHDGGSLSAKIIFQLDQASLSDKWVRVIIPADKLYFYEEINYNRTPKTADDFKNVVIQRALIVGETKKGAVLRGDITSWSSSVPETFKEMDLSFKKIEFQLK